MLSNLLLVLDIAFIAAGLVTGVSSFKAAGAGTSVSCWVLFSLALMLPVVYSYIPESTIAMCVKSLCPGAATPRHGLELRPRAQRCDGGHVGSHLSGSVVLMVVVHVLFPNFFVLCGGSAGTSPCVFSALAFRWVGTPVPPVAHARSGMGQGGVLGFGVRHSLN